MGGIDDKFEALDKQTEDKGDPIFRKIWHVVSELEPFGILNAFNVLFSQDATAVRFEAFIQELVSEVRRLDESGRFLRARVESPEFKETLMVAINETARTIDREKIKRFASVVGGTLDSTRTLKNWDDAAAYIRDLAQVSDGDIQVLKILYAAQKDLFLGKNLSLDPNSYTEKNNEVLELAHKSGIPRDEFYSRCARLNGFGLAIEVQRNDSRVSPGDHCFRLTTRGRELVSIIMS